MTRALPFACVALLAASCSAPEQVNNSNLMANIEDLPNNLIVPPDETTDNLSDTDSPANNLAANSTVGGDGSQITLSPLRAADLAKETLAGELGCSFTPEGEETLLVAKGDVGSKQAAQGVVKVGDYVERISAPGGFNGITKGATFSGQGKTIIIKLTGAAIGGGESPPRPATLTYQRADGAERTFNGRWVCGP